MSLLKKIFKKKPGGTFLGNALRGVVKKTTGIELKAPPIENPAPVQTSQDNAKMTADIIGGYLNNALGPKLESITAKVANSEQGQNLMDSVTAAAMKSAQKSVKDQVIDFLKTKWWLLLIPFGVIGYFIYARTKPKKGSYKKY